MIVAIIVFILIIAIIAAFIIAISYLVGFGFKLAWGYTMDDCLEGLIPPQPDIQWPRQGA